MLGFSLLRSSLPGNESVFSAEAQGTKSSRSGCYRLGQAVRTIF